MNKNPNLTPCTHVYAPNFHPIIFSPKFTYCLFCATENVTYHKKNKFHYFYTSERTHVNKRPCSHERTRNSNLHVGQIKCVFDHFCSSTEDHQAMLVLHAVGCLGGGSQPVGCCGLWCKIATDNKWEITLHLYKFMHIAQRVLRCNKAQFCFRNKACGSLNTLT